MKIFRWWGISAFFLTALILLLSWYLIAPIIFKSSIESAGTQMLGAKFDVDQVELHLLPLGVSINGIAATDPDQPMQNLFELKTIKFSIDNSILLWKKILIDELKIEGLKLGTKRKNNGSIEKSQESVNLENSKTGQLFNTSLPELNKIDIKALVDKADLVTLKSLKQLEKKQQSLNKFWENEIENSQHEITLKEIEAAFNRLSKRAKNNSFNLITDRKAWKKLKSDISKERKLISALNKRLKTDKKELAQMLVQVKSSPQKDLDYLLSKTGLNNGLSGMSKTISDQLIGPQFTPWIEKLIDFTKQNKNTNKKQSDSKAVTYQTKNGPMVQFEDKNIFPDLFIKHVSLSGKDKQWSTSGEGNNLGYYPWIINKPANLNIKVKGLTDQSGANIIITSEWKNPLEMNTQIQSKVKDWGINKIKLLQSEQGNWMIDSGTLDASLDGQITLEGIDIKLKIAITNANIQPPEGLSGWQTSLATSLASQKTINLTVLAKGSLNHPSISVKTNLEKLFTSAIGDNLKEQASKYKKAFKNEISKRVGDMSKLDGINGDFENWTDALKSNDQLLEKLKIDL
jgi:uncharacterized protein (TIGR03545 family)